MCLNLFIMLHSRNNSIASQTFGTTLVFMIAMALHSDKQRLAQQEIGLKIETARLPLLSGRSSLTHVDALVKEVMRWHPMIPLSTSFP